MYSEFSKNNKEYPHDNQIDLAVFILFYEKLEQTIRCIKSFLESGVKIYLLNNASSKISREKLGEFCEKYRQITIFDSDTNLGVGVGRNYLLSHTAEKWLLFVDNDIFIKTKSWLDKIRKQISFHKDIEIFIPKLYNINERQYIKYGSLRITKDHRLKICEIKNNMTNLFPGGASFIYRKLFDRIGEYDPEMFVGWEDYELSIRAIYSRLPIKAHLIKDIELIHDHRSTRKIEDQKSILIRYDLNLNENSYYHMIGKYHLFGFTESNWKMWISQQIEHSLRKPNQKSEREKNIISFLMNKGNLIRLFVETAEKMIPGSIFWVLKYKLFKIKDLPLSCTLYITNKCNFKCPHCHRNVVGIEQFNEMTLTIVEKLVKLYPSITSFCVAGYGEPTLAKDFVEIVNFLVDSGKTVGIITNGTNSDKLLTLSHSPSYISISLNGYNNESYLETSGVPAYEKVIATFLKLRSNFKNVGFSYILKRANFRDLEKILPLLDKLKPNFLHLHNYLVYNIDLKEEIQQIITVEDTEIIRYIDKICTGHDYQIQKPIYVDFNNPRHNCKSYTYLINVNGDGNIGGCLRQKPPNASFGNLFREIDPFNSREMCGYRAQLYKAGYPHKECRFCFGNWG